MTQTPVTSTGMSAFPGFLQNPPLRVPNAKGVEFKREINIIQAPNELKITESGFQVFGAKMNIWFLPDLERETGEGEAVVQFHNHPWDFLSRVVVGRLIETRAAWNLETGKLDTSVFIREEGETYLCLADEYHLVTEVAPGTTTIMQMGPKKRPFIDKNGNTQHGEWGYLTESGQKLTATGRDAAPNPGFLERLWALNEHLRPKS
jgi:hypothetical protein